MVFSCNEMIPNRSSIYSFLHQSIKNLLFFTLCEPRTYLSLSHTML